MAGTKNGVLVGKNADFTQVNGPNAQSSESNGLSTNGQLWIGTTTPNVGGTHISVGNITSPDGSSTIGYSAPNITLTSALGSGRYPITPYVVGPSGLAGYQTIQSAINAAHAAGGGIIYLQPGTYTENLVFYDAIQIRGTQAYENSFSTIIIGIHTPPLTGQVAIAEVEMQSSTHIFSSVSAGSSAISFFECTFNLTNGYIFNLPNWTGNGFNINDCGELSVNNGVLNNSGGAPLFTNNCQIGAGTANPLIANGDVRLDLTFLACPAQISGGTIFFNFVLLPYTLTLSGNVSGNIYLADFFPASGPALMMSSSGNINLFESSINTANNPAIDGSGAGTLSLGSILFNNNKTIANTLTISSTGGYFPAGSLGSSGYVWTSNGAGAVPTFQANAAIFTWSLITGSGSLAKSNGYIVTSNALSLALPATAGSAVGDRIQLVLSGGTSWTITQAASQQIRVGSVTTTVTTGTLVSTAQGDWIELVYQAAGLWIASIKSGNITVT